MSKFAEAAKIAYEELKKYKKSISKDEVESIWRKSCKMTGLSDNSTQKSCPKNAFLGVVRSGILNLDVNLDNFKITKNENHAIKAIEVLKTTNGSYKPKELWEAIGNGISYDSQMHVVLSMWKEVLKNV